MKYQLAALLLAASVPALSQPVSPQVEQLRAAALKDDIANVRVEMFDMPVWVRGEEKAWITAPFPQPLAVTALGNSGATPPEGIEAELVGFSTLDELKASPDAAVRGKIVFVDHQMPRTQESPSYGHFRAPR